MQESIISRFSLAGRLLSVERFGSGLINETYLCAFDDEGVVRKYILQRINRTVFPQPEQVMENVEIVTAHIQERLRRRGVDDPAGVTPALVRTATGGSFHVDGAGETWRMFHFIEDGEVFDRVRDSAHAAEVGRALGRFQDLVSDLPPHRLRDTLPGFHHTPRHLQELDDAVRRDALGRAAAVRVELDLVERHRSLAPLLMNALASGKAPIRVVHNDPKVNNVMVRRDTGEAICMVDLDTVKPGIVPFDYGDCVRSAANRAGEDAGRLDEVELDRQLAGAITNGYLEEAGRFLTREERDLLPLSVPVITFELGVRFLTDHLRGDVYFQVRRPDQNLHRARVQFRLLDTIDEATWS